MVDVERFRWESAEALAPGRRTVVFDFAYDGPGIGKGGTGVLTVDGREVARLTIPHTTPALEAVDEGCDIGYDTRAGVDDRDYRVPFTFTGTINKVTFKPGLPQLTPEQAKRAAEMRARGKD
jgi:arylsulfatase